MSIGCNRISNKYAAHSFYRKDTKQKPKRPLSWMVNSATRRTLRQEKEDKLNLIRAIIYELNEFDKAIMLSLLEEKCPQEIKVLFWVYLKVI